MIAGRAMVRARSLNSKWLYRRHEHWRGRSEGIVSAFVRSIRTTSTQIETIIIFLRRDKRPLPASEAIYRVRKSTWTSRESETGVSRLNGGKALDCRSGYRTAQMCSLRGPIDHHDDHLPH
jgi:hypothetical protein